MVANLSDGVDQLQTYLGRVLDSQERATAELHIRQSADLVHAYTKGVGFSPDLSIVEAALMAVIVSRAARSMHNPTDLASWNSAGVSQRPGRSSWTIGELRAMERFKKMAGSFVFMDD